MANSLIELYGGGMAGKSNNYQLGGRIAGAKRRRGYQGEMRELRKKQEEAAKRQRRASGLGNVLSTVGGIAGSFIPIPGVGTALGASLGTALGAGLGRLAGESTYKGVDVGGGKYAQETRGDVQRASDDYQRSMGERALAQGIKSGVMKFATAGGGDYLKAKFNPAEAMPVDTQAIDAAKSAYAETTPLDITSPQVTALFDPDSIAAQQTAAGEAAKQWAQGVHAQGLADNPWLNETVDEFWSQVPYDETSQATGIRDYLQQFAPSEGFSTFRGGGLIGMTVPQYGNGGPMERGFGYNSPIGNTDDSAQQGWFGNDPNVRNQLNQLNQSGWSGVNLDMSNIFNNPYVWAGAGRSGKVGGVGGAGGGPSAPYTPGYGTATNVTGALTQMGMGDIANDPRFAQYADDLPDFQMGYAQQVGDIYTGAQQAARGMRGQQRQAAGQRGFSGSGIGQRQSQQAFGDLRTDVARQRRGVVEGYQADLLSAIGDIEQKGEFEFTGTPSESLKQQMTVEELMATGLTANEAQDAFYAQQTSRDFG